MSLELRHLCRAAGICALLSFGNLSTLRGGTDLAEQIATSLAQRKGDQNLFLNHDSSKFVRNPQFWLKGVEGLNAIQMGDAPGATAITPWHVVGANHSKH